MQQKTAVPFLSCRQWGTEHPYLVNLNQVVAIRIRTDGRGDELHTIDGGIFETGTYDTGEFQPEQWGSCFTG